MGTQGCDIHYTGLACAKAAELQAHNRRLRHAASKLARIRWANGAVATGPFARRAGGIRRTGTETAEAGTVRLAGTESAGTRHIGTEDHYNICGDKMTDTDQRAQDILAHKEF